MDKNIEKIINYIETHTVKTAHDEELQAEVRKLTGIHK